MEVSYFEMENAEILAKTDEDPSFLWAKGTKERLFRIDEALEPAKEEMEAVSKRL